MVACAMKWNGGYVWACKNYDGDVQSDTVAQGFGSLGLMTKCTNDTRWKNSRVRSMHMEQLQDIIECTNKEKKLLLNPIASIFAWTRGLAHRGKLDNNNELIKFSADL